MSDLYRLVYASRNLLGGGEDEQSAAVAGILAMSKRNNARVGVTGALLFNAGSFAQVLEGPRAAVEVTFERIQRDTRHSDVSVLQCEPVASRGFPNWSMAFVGQSARGRALWQGVASETDFDLSRIEGDRLFATLLAIVEEEEGVAAPTAKPEVGLPRGDGLDVERLRAALDAMPRDQRAAASSVPAPAVGAASPRPSPPPVMVAGAVTQRRATVSPEVENEVLRASLDEERQRTTELRRQLDESRIALAAARGEAEALGRHRDIWADRSLQQRSSLRTMRADLATRSDEVASLGARLAGLDEDVFVLSRQRDIWAERARVLASAFCRDPDVEKQLVTETSQGGSAVERGTRPALVKTTG